MTEKTPDLAFVIPAFNSEAYLAEAIAGCLVQSHRNIEVIVIDDGSTDATPRVIKHYSEADQRIRSFRIPNSGRGTARNVGCGAANARLLAVLDSDDIPDRDRAKNTIALASDNPDAYFSGGASILDVFCVELGRVIPEPFTLERALKEKTNGIVHSTSAYSKSLWARYKYDEGEYQAIGIDDWHQQIRMAMAGVQFVSTPKILTGYRVVSTGVSKTRDEAKVRALKDKFLVDTQNAIYA